MTDDERKAWDQKLRRTDAEIARLDAAAANAPRERRRRRVVVAPILGPLPPIVSTLPRTPVEPST